MKPRNWVTFTIITAISIVGCDSDKDNDASGGSGCYTPCKSGTVIGGEYVPCSDEGLMEGCFGQTSCVNGWCVLDSEKAKSSAAIPGANGILPVLRGVSDSDAGLNPPGNSNGKCVDDCGCGEHGACVNSKCTPGCEEDGECEEDEICYKKVCRQKCSTGSATSDPVKCPVDTTCVIGDDGENGTCMPKCTPMTSEVVQNCLRSTAGDLVPFELTGGDLAVDSLFFNGSTESLTFEVINNTQCALDLTITKVSHIVHTQEGSTTVEENALHWVEITSEDVEVKKVGNEYLLEKFPGDGNKAVITVSGAKNDSIPNWNGTVQLGARGSGEILEEGGELTPGEDLGRRIVNLSYSSGVDGQWAGSMFYFGNFGDNNIEEWVNETDPAAKDALAATVGNALIRRWGVLFRGAISLDNFGAALSSTLTGAWSWPTVRDKCPSKEGACYPFADPDETPDDGIEEFSDDLGSAPVPGGVVELPIVMNVELDTTGPALNTFKGKILSDITLHYAGDPMVEFALAKDHGECDQVGKVCKNDITSFGSDIVVGGRFIPGDNGMTCSDIPDFVEKTTPWLVEGFTGGTRVQGGKRDVVECRDTTKPFDVGSPLLPLGVAAFNLNSSYAGSNPLPTGQSLKRTLTLLDGAFFNKSDMFILFKETFSVEMGGDQPEDFSGYGMMILRRSPVTLEAQDYIGSDQQDDRTFDQVSHEPGCSQEFLDEVDGGIENFTDLASVVVGGAVGNWDVGDTMSTEDIYYLCHETGQFAGGYAIEDDIAEDAGVPEPHVDRWCPISSGATFFYFRFPHPDDPVALACNDELVTNQYEQPTYETGEDGKPIQTGTSSTQVVVEKASCLTELNKYDKANVVLLDPISTCSSSESPVCDGDEWDRRMGKRFFPAADGTAYRDLQRQIYEAFRYKIAFRSRNGKNIGFTPEVCSDSPGGVPYCYNPDIIEEIQKRSDCALYLWANRASHSDFNADALGAALTNNFKSNCIYPENDERCSTPEAQQDGFEALLAELLIMLGDDAYTTSFASRFDLAGMGKATFEGDRFEEGGINLTGAAGYEMYSLYKAVQYYQLALDRFYSLMPAIYNSLNNDSTKSFITADTVTNYFDRLIRASTQKARAWAEITKRYQSFNQPVLARRVIERAYTASYLESVLITSMMKQVTRITKSAAWAQIEYIVDQAQLRYKASLLELQDINQSITDDVNYFGYPPEYIPFPATDEGDYAEGNINAFDKLRDSAVAKIEFAAAKEEAALSSSRDFEVDYASFQAELANIRKSYENDLADICGTFEAVEDGRIYPAISDYGYLDEKAKTLQDPCGLMGNGDIFEALKEAEKAQGEANLLVHAIGRKTAEIAAELIKIGAICGIRITWGAVKLGVGAAAMSLEQVTDCLDKAKDDIAKGVQTGVAISRNIKCNVGVAVSCPQAAAAAASQTGITAAGALGELGFEAAQQTLKVAKGLLQKKLDMGEEVMECALAGADGVAAVANLVFDLTEVGHELANSGKEITRANSVVVKLQHKAKRLQVELTEAEQHAINIEAARNDPNVRIYKNDAIINADKAFWSAVREVYKATKVYEYYTSTTYAHLVDLFLVRMVTAGDYNLENYLGELDDAFYEFEESYTNPDMRLAIISTRDDIFEIPRLSAENPGVSLSEQERADLFTESLTNPDVGKTTIDDFGYIRIPFNTQLSEVSPLTRNHKIFYIEAEILGDDVGDAAGRLYVTQKGTGTVRSVDGDKIYYSFPERMAVVDTFFNGLKEIDHDSIYHTVYRNDRFLDRPYANSDWELIFNGVDEAVNKDINLASITDIRLYVYYTDFTAMP
ncbi:MAG: hypothetical protein GY854_10160 [Deltaproteobacteria bacterium]|nr:hypothetical protein [Deltaproteobacteria bacterium]